MWILDQQKTDLYRLESINTIALHMYENGGSVDIGATQLGYYNNKDTAKQVYQMVINWLAYPYQNGALVNIFYMPEDMPKW